MSSKHMCNFIAILNLGVRTKKRSISVVLKNTYLKLLIDLLHKEGLIYGYEIKKTGKCFNGHDEEKATIYFKKNLISAINILSSPSYKRSVTVYKLNSLLYKNRGTIFIISSSVLGLTTSYECIKNNIGGLLICGIRLDKSL